jgi:hypothetical protein
MPLKSAVERWGDEAAGLGPRRLIRCDGSQLEHAPDRVETALHVERDESIESLSDLGEFYRQFGSRLPAMISRELATTARRLTT